MQQFRVFSFCFVSYSVIFPVFILLLPSSTFVPSLFLLFRPQSIFHHVCQLRLLITNERLLTSDRTTLFCFINYRGYYRHMRGENDYTLRLYRQRKEDGLVYFRLHSQYSSCRSEEKYENYVRLGVATKMTRLQS